MPNPIVKRTAGGYTTPEGFTVKHRHLYLADGSWWFIWRMTYHTQRSLVAVKYAKDGAVLGWHSFTSS